MQLVSNIKANFSQPLSLLASSPGHGLGTRLCLSSLPATRVTTLLLNRPTRSCSDICFNKMRKERGKNIDKFEKFYNSHPTTIPEKITDVERL